MFTRDNFDVCCRTLQELSVYGFGGFEYRFNLCFRIVFTTLDFSLFLTCAVLSWEDYLVHEFDFSMPITSYGSDIIAV